MVLGGVLAALGLALAIGGYNPLYPFLYQVVPGLGLFRVPARWLFVYSFGVALLAGLGAESGLAGRAGAQLAADASAAGASAAWRSPRGPRWPRSC